jgi:hypothetical protein
MRYEHEDLGFSFDLPDGWRRDEHIVPLTFFGPNGRLGWTSEVIQIKIGTISPQYLDAVSREQFLAEPGATVSRTTVGGESNAVVLQKASDSEISVVHDGVHYIIAHTNDAATDKAIEQLRKSAQFPLAGKSAAAIQAWSDPKKQAFGHVLEAGSPEEARQILSEAGMQPVVQRPGYSIDNLESPPMLRVEDLNNRDFEIAKSSPPILRGVQLSRALAAVCGKRIFLEYDRTIDGPQTASRLIRETLIPQGASFPSTMSAADIAVWVGGTGHMQFAFVVLDAKDYSRYECYLCDPRELTAAIMTTVAQFADSPRAVRPWWKFW